MTSKQKFTIIHKQKGDVTITNKEFIFNSLSFGNLILTKRLQDTSKLEHGHKTAPFLVLRRKDNYLICLYITSKENKSSLIKISKNNYNFKKDTYITSNISLIPIDQFITQIYHLTEKESKNLLKVLYMKGLENYTSFAEPTLEIGDIIQLKQLHLIISETADNYITIKVEYNSSHKTYEFNY